MAKQKKNVWINLFTSASLRVQNISDGFRQESESASCFDHDRRNFFEQICHQISERRRSTILQFGLISLNEAFGNAGHRNLVRFGRNFEAKFFNFFGILDENANNFRGKFKNNFFLQISRIHRILTGEIFWNDKKCNVKRIRECQRTQKITKFRYNH